MLQNYELQCAVGGWRRCRRNSWSCFFGWRTYHQRVQGACRTVSRRAAAGKVLPSVLVKRLNRFNKESASKTFLTTRVIFVCLAPHPPRIPPPHAQTLTSCPFSVSPPTLVTHFFSASIHISFYGFSLNPQTEKGSLLVEMSEEIWQELLLASQVASNCSARSLVEDDTWLRHPSGKYYSIDPHGLLQVICLTCLYSLRLIVISY